MNKKFVFKEFIRGGFNLNFLLEEASDPHNKWVGKITKSHNNFIDFRNRHLIAYELAKLLDVKIPRSVMVKKNQIVNASEIQAHNPSLKGLTEVQASEFKGINLEEFLASSHKLEDIVNINEVFESWVFNLWLGNYDRKARDYVVDCNNQCWFIDYDLSGIGFEAAVHLKASLGYGANPYNFRNLNHTRLCAFYEPNYFKMFISIFEKEKRVSIFERMIKKIEGLSQEKIKKAVNKYDIFRQSWSGLVKINGEFIEELLERRKDLRDVVHSWCGFLP